VHIEGLRSYKAIAFINRKADIRLDAKAYSELRMSLQRKTAVFPRNIEFRVATALDPTLMKKIGDEKWKK